MKKTITDVRLWQQSAIVDCWRLIVTSLLPNSGRIGCLRPFYGGLTGKNCILATFEMIFTKMRFSTWWRFLKLLLHFSSNLAEIWFVYSQHILKIFQATIFGYLAPFLKKVHKRLKIHQFWLIFGRLYTFFQKLGKISKNCGLKNF